MGGKASHLNALRTSSARSDARAGLALAQKADMPRRNRRAKQNMPVPQKPKPKPIYPPLSDIVVLTGDRPDAGLVFDHPGQVQVGIDPAYPGHEIVLQGRYDPASGTYTYYATHTGAASPSAPPDPSHEPPDGPRSYGVFAPPAGASGHGQWRFQSTSYRNGGIVRDTRDAGNKWVPGNWFATPVVNWQNSPYFPEAFDGMVLDDDLKSSYALTGVQPDPWPELTALKRHDGSIGGWRTCTCPSCVELRGGLEGD